MTGMLNWCMAVACDGCMYVCGWGGGTDAMFGGRAGMYGCAASGFTALMWAAQNGHVEAVQHLLERGADIHAANHDGGCSDEREGQNLWNGLLSPSTREKV